ncbi:MAG: amidase family protein [Pigmentiphaga sp.]|nr:amidase family protein [Pigmentiphaga sp.]
MAEAPWWSRSVKTLTDAYLEGRTTPVEVVDTLLSAARTCQSGLNAFAQLALPGSRAAAEAATRRFANGKPLGPLDGVPISVKDLVPVQGVPTRRGSHITPNTPAEQDAPAVARLRQAGAIVFGVTTTSELGCSMQASNPLNGTTLHPLNPKHTPGGSSSGAAAHVAAGLGPLALASDVGGSLRVPAAYCGLVGFKGTYGAIPTVTKSVFTDYIHYGPLARSMDDCRRLQAMLAHPDPRDPSSLWARPRPILQLAERQVKIGWTTQLGPQVALDPEVDAAFLQSVQLLAAQLPTGWTLEEVDLTDVDLAEPLWTDWTARMAEAFLDAPDSLMEQLGADLQLQLKQGRLLTARGLAHAKAQIRQQRIRLIEHFSPFDLLLTPSSPHLAPPAGQWIPPGHPLTQQMEETGNWFLPNPYTYPFNLTQQPALTLPIGKSETGLPMGLQIVGQRYQDELVLAAGTCVEHSLTPP